MARAGWRETPLRGTYDWMGPEHSPRDIRTSKAHLVSGGLALAQRSPDEVVVALLGRCDRGRTSDQGALLNVTIHPSTPNGAMGDEIALA